MKHKLRFRARVAEIPVNVEAYYSPARMGCWYRRNGDPGDPPEPAEVEILAVTDDTGTDLLDLVNGDEQFLMTLEEAAAVSYDDAERAAIKQKEQ
jgi:hypothetical protein